MEARTAAALPAEADWLFEPKWDGFRCLAFRDGEHVTLRSKSGKPLERYFPEIAAALLALPQRHYVLDGELVIPAGQILSFEALQMRLHPAESRIRKLAAQTPARMMLFDCLLSEQGQSLLERPLIERRGALEHFVRHNPCPSLLLSEQTGDRARAQAWLNASGGALDGVVAKRAGEPYVPGERAMLKIKRLRSADCVVGGFRYASKERLVGSLLLGLYNEDGKLDHVGFTSAIAADQRVALTGRLEALIAPPGFTGNAPGGPSRWSTDRSADWQPLRPDLVAEVRFDHVTGRRFRHGTKFLRWRPDKDPAQCRFDQLEQ